MNWKKEAIDKLVCYNARKRALRTIPNQIKELRLRRQGIHAARTDGVAVGGGTRREDRIINSIVYEEELRERLAATKLWVESVDEALACLDDQERLILDRFYISPHSGSADRLCEELAMERSSVYRKKDQALRRFTMALYGWENS